MLAFNNATYYEQPVPYEAYEYGMKDVVRTQPDGHVYAVAVMIPKTRRPIRERLAMMHDVMAAVAKTWGPTRPARASPSAPAAHPAAHARKAATSRPLGRKHKSG